MSLKPDPVAVDTVSLGSSKVAFYISFDNVVQLATHNIQLDVSKSPTEANTL